jgi:hypothetical protein
MVIFAPKDMLNHQETDPKNGIHHPHAQPQSFNFGPQLFEQPDGKRHVPAQHLAAEQRQPGVVFVGTIGPLVIFVASICNIQPRSPVAGRAASEQMPGIWAAPNHGGSSCESWNNWNNL